MRPTEYWTDLRRDHLDVFFEELAALTESERRQVIRDVTLKINEGWLKENGLAGVPESVQIAPDYMAELRRRGRHLRIVTPLPTAPKAPPPPADDEADFSDLFAEVA